MTFSRSAGRARVAGNRCEHPKALRHLPRPDRHRPSGTAKPNQHLRPRRGRFESCSASRTWSRARVTRFSSKRWPGSAILTGGCSASGHSSGIRATTRGVRQMISAAVHSGDWPRCRLRLRAGADWETLPGALQSTAYADMAIAHLRTATDPALERVPRLRARQP
jgi:hypothetical protein